MSRKVLSTNYLIPNAKDKSEWYAGGTLRGETFAGGEYFSVYNSPAFKNKRRGVDLSISLNSGFLNSKLLPSLIKINKIINGGNYLDLMREYNINSTKVLNYTIEIKDDPTDEIISFSSGEIDISDYKNITSNKSNFSLEEIALINKNSFNLLGMINNANAVNIALTLKDMYNQEMTFEQMIGSGLLGSSKSIMTSFVNNSIGKVLGLSTANIAQALTVQTIAGMIVGELVEMALGLDNHFGFGGEYVGTDKYGLDHFTDPVDFFTGVKDMALEIGTFGAHYSQTEFNEDEKLAELRNENWSFEEETNRYEQGLMTIEEEIEHEVDTWDGEGDGDGDFTGDGTETVGSGAGSFGPGGEDGSGSI